MDIIRYIFIIIVSILGIAFLIYFVVSAKQLGPISDPRLVINRKFDIVLIWTPPTSGSSGGTGSTSGGPSVTYEITYNFDTVNKEGKSIHVSNTDYFVVKPCYNITRRILIKYPTANNIDIEIKTISKSELSPKPLNVKIDITKNSLL